MKSKLDDLAFTVTPGLNPAVQVISDQGLAYLELRRHLLLSYAINSVFYLLLKTEGREVAGCTTYSPHGT